MGPVTIDASVFVRATIPSEDGHAACSAIIQAVGRGAGAIILPTFLIPELAGALGRRSLPKADVAAILVRIRQMPGVTFVPLDDALAEEAADLAVSARVRGADSLYVAVARRYGSVLITADQQQRVRSPAGLEAISPEEAAERFFVG